MRALICGFSRSHRFKVFSETSDPHAVRASRMVIPMARARQYAS